MKTLIGTLAFALASAWLGPALDDNSAEQAMADEAIEAQQIERIKRQAYQSAERRCLESRGLGAVPMVDDFGNFSGCAARRKS
jgi:hypothetical protein